MRLSPDPRFGAWTTSGEIIHQSPNKGRRWCREHRLEIAGLGYSPLLHYRESIAKRGCLAQIMRNEKGRHTALAKKVPECRQQILLQTDVEIGQWFVQQHCAWLKDQRPSNCDTLPLATG